MQVFVKKTDGVGHLMSSKQKQVILYKTVTRRKLMECFVSSPFKKAQNKSYSVLQAQQPSGQSDIVQNQ